MLSEHYEFRGARRLQSASLSCTIVPSSPELGAPNAAAGVVFFNDRSVNRHENNSRPAHESERLFIFAPAQGGPKKGYRWAAVASRYAAAYPGSMRSPAHSSTTTAIRSKASTSCPNTALFMSREIGR